MLFEDNFPYLVLKITITLFGTVGMMCSTVGFSCSRKKAASLFFVFFIHSLASSSAIIYFFGYQTFLRLFIVTISFPAILTINIVSKANRSQRIFTRATHILFSLYIAGSITLINTALNGTMLSDILLRLSAYTLAVFLEFAFLRKPFMQFANIITGGWIILSLIPCSLIVLVVTIAFYPVHYAKSSSSVLLLYLLGAVIIIIYFSIFQYLNMQYRVQISEHNQEILALQVESLKEKNARTAAMEEKARIDRHDMRHRFQTAIYLIKTGDTEHAIKYINQSLSYFDIAEPAHYCDNPILNATLCSYLGQAASENIKLETDISIPHDLPVDEGELSIIFANALENAIKACVKLPVKERKIICKCIYKPKLMLEISNPYSGNIVFSRDKLPVSNETGHGIGSRSIMAFCKKYNAFYLFNAENGYFTLTISL